MKARSARNRRVPPKGNPGEQQQQGQQFYTGQQMAIPWKTLVLTTGITTLTGYVMLEVLRGLHRYFKHRSLGHVGAMNPQPQGGGQDERHPGALPDGSFQLPIPQGTTQPSFSETPHGGFAAPQLVDVNNPVGRLQHDFGQYQSEINARLSRIEHAMSGGYGATG